MESDEVSRVDPEGLSFFNVNTADDLAEAETIHARLAANAG